VLRLVTHGNTAHDYDPHVRRVAQALLIGPPGYGKSLLIGLFDALLEQVLFPRNGLSVILDKDGSNELSVLARGGYYVRIQRGQGSGMAPLIPIRKNQVVRHVDEIALIGMSSNRGCRAFVQHW
jgi:type IV secretion system protein VirB4